MNFDQPAPATVVIPTRARPDYLRAALSSIAPQAQAAGAELVVVSDGPDAQVAEEAERHGARLLTLPQARGLNAARNLALAQSRSDLVIFVDDDVRVPDGWLDALLEGAHRDPTAHVYGGPIRPVLSDGPRACGREPAPISALDLGPADRDADHVWGANMAVRRSAVELAGPFDEALLSRGDEEEWQDRLQAAGGRIRYLAAAGLDHTRNPADSRLTRLMAANYHLGRDSRALDVRLHRAPSPARELRDLLGALWHLIARRCAYGLVFAAHAVGRLQEMVLPLPDRAGEGDAGAPQDDFLSGDSGYVAGVRAVTRARLRDLTADAVGLASRRRLRCDAAAWGVPQDVLVLTLERRGEANLLEPALEELRRSQHRLDVARGDVGELGKFENLNRLLAGRDLERYAWLIVLDDDVTLPRGFLDGFLFLAGRFGLDLAQPAHRALSHAAWPVTRRRAAVAVRETGFVEIGPITAFRHRVLDGLLPFPDLRFGWGLDLHWAALAREHGWRCGVVDATAIEHRLRPVASAYSHAEAVAEARGFLRGRPHLRAAEAAQTLAVHRAW